MTEAVSVVPKLELSLKETIVEAPKKRSRSKKVIEAISVDPKLELSLEETIVEAPRKRGRPKKVIEET